MNIGEYTKKAKIKLEQAGISTADLDILVLLEDLLHTNRAQLLAHPEREITNEQKNTLDDQIIRRAEKHEPLAYIRGKTEFYGRKFVVTPNVLVPRPETEAMIDVLKTLKLTNKAIIADIGTGSGAIAITTKLELPETTVVASDIDPDCIKVAKINVVKQSTDILLKVGDILEPIETPIDVILANLPYVPSAYTINKAAKFEPKLAIFGGNDGLDLYHKLFAQIDLLASKPTYVITESMPAQHKQLSTIAQKSGYKLLKTNDFIQLFQSAD